MANEMDDVIKQVVSNLNMPQTPPVGSPRSYPTSPPPVAPKPYGVGPTMTFSGDASSIAPKGWNPVGGVMPQISTEQELSALNKQDSIPRSNFSVFDNPPVNRPTGGGGVLAAPPVSLPPAGASHVGGIAPTPTKEAQLDLSQFGSGGTLSPVKPESPPESPIYDRINPTANGGYTLSPKDRPPEPATPQAPKADFGVIDNMIERIQNDPKNIHPISKTLSDSARHDIVALMQQRAHLQASELTGQFGVKGHEVTAEATREGHGLAAKERVSLEKDKLAETVRYHDILDMNAKDKLVSDKFLREEAIKLRDTQGEDSLMKTYGQFENSLGEKGYHPAVAIFKLIDSGYDVDTLSKQWKATANQVREGFRAYALKAKVANPKLTPAQIKAAYYDELRGAK